MADENTASELILFHSERYWKIAPVSFLFLSMQVRSRPNLQPAAVAIISVKLGSSLS